MYTPCIVWTSNLMASKSMKIYRRLPYWLFIPTFYCSYVTRTILQCNNKLSGKYKKMSLESGIHSWLWQCLRAIITFGIKTDSQDRHIAIFMRRKIMRTSWKWIQSCLRKKPEKSKWFIIIYLYFDNSTWWCV